MELVEADKPKSLGEKIAEYLARPKKGHSPTMLLRETQAKIRELEAENGQLIKALETSQMIFYINEN